MKNLLKLCAILISSVVMVACQKEDNNPEHDNGLSAPVLTAPAFGEEKVLPTPTFIWKTSGDGVVYDVSLSDDDGETWETVAEELSATTYTLTDDQQLALNSTYFWKVTATLDGNSKESLTSFFNTTVFMLDLPGPDTENVSVMPTLTWSEMQGENMVYDLSISTDNGATWRYMVKDLIHANHTFTRRERLYYSTDYQFKVTARSKSTLDESNVISFTTVAGNLPGAPYTDDKYYLYLDSPKANPFNIYIMADGFTQKDYDTGLFDETVDAMMETFFCIEPYKSYKDYFRVYKMVTISNESGITETQRDTKFGSRTNGTLIQVGSSSVYRYVMSTVGIDNNTLNNSYLVIITNSDVYGGNCYNEFGSSLRALTLIPAFHPDTGFINIHESGHGIGKLGDEYGPNMTNLNMYRQGDPWRCYPNIDITGNRDDAVWAKYYGLPGYEEVGYFGQTAFWCPSQRSIMRSGTEQAVDGFNAISREAIVRRLLKTAGEEFDFETFLEKDSNEKPVFPNR